MNCLSYTFPQPSQISFLRHSPKKLKGFFLLHSNCKGNSEKNKKRELVINETLEPKILRLLQTMILFLYL